MLTELRLACAKKISARVSVPQIATRLVKCNAVAFEKRRSTEAEVWPGQPKNLRAMTGYLV